ncbi:hypothetical protein CHU95_17745 [Niveispirillum lacus]|uniref:DUF4239 domain-containing protein n=1 Tax=Niveispirillum lacus TaxID=1981099 RepID=A0A255YW21_9PROT|nr:hypothetical protein [Niveispirillum lacus]OYQ32620.1 hypothetical protein CHU95_17745 [Niveispirillum lacus]
MREFLYSQDSMLVAILLLVSLFVIIELGVRVGRTRRDGASEAYRSHVNTIQGSILGLMALLLGFTFSMALQRFDARSDAMVDEANAIGTTYLRAQMLTPEVRGTVSSLLRDYVELRVAAVSVSLDHPAERQALVVRSTAVLDQIWIQAQRAVLVDPGPATSGLFIQTLNETIDSFGRHDAILNRHVPELVLFMLYGAVLLTGWVLGFSCGIAGHRPSGVAFAFGLAVVAIAFVIIDIDRPRRGLIQVNQSSLTSLAAEIVATEAARAQTSQPAPVAGRRSVTGRP